MTDDFIDTITDALEGTAHWRREKATDYPNDRRNDTAAEELERLAEAIRANPQSDAATRLRNLDEELTQRVRTEKNFDDSTLTIECSDYRRRIGFSEFPSTGEQYLATLAAMYREHLTRARGQLLVLGADDIRQLRTAAAELRSKVSQGSYGDEQLELFWELTRTAGPTLKISNPELSMRAGLGDGFFMSVSRDHRRPKLVNFLKALTTIVEVADERLAAIKRVGPASDRASPLKDNGRDWRSEEGRDDLLALVRSLSRMALDEIRKLDDERPNDSVAIESNRRYRELLQIFADGFEQIVVALAALGGGEPKAPLVKRANDVVRSVGNEVKGWLSKNGAELVDWSVRIPFFTAGVAALGWAGADMTVATTAIAAIVGGQKVVDVLRRNKKPDP